MVLYSDPLRQGYSCGFAMGVAYLVFLFIIVIQLYYGLNWGINKVIFFILLMTIAFGIVLEWWEIFSDLYFGSKFFWNLQDGYGDWLANAIGALIVAWDSKRLSRIQIL